MILFRIRPFIQSGFKLQAISTKMKNCFLKRFQCFLHEFASTAISNEYYKARSEFGSNGTHAANFADNVLMKVSVSHLNP